MSHRKLNLLADFYFGLILLSGILYSAFVVVAGKKILPGFAMQLIFLVDSIKFDENILNLVLSKTFGLNIFSGLVVVTLIMKYLTAINRALVNISETRRVVNRLRLTREPVIFTAGLLKPRIFISKAIFKLHSQDEIEAMRLHEESHRKNFHPVKIFAARLIEDIYPNFPGRKWLIDHYLTLNEVACDKFAEERISSKEPLVSALYKLQKYGFEAARANINYFNSQSERIKILVGRSKLTGRPVALYSMVVVMVLLSTVWLQNSNVFFDCRHVLSCLKTLVSSNSQPLVIPGHCQ